MEDALFSLSGVKPQRTCGVDYGCSMLLELIQDIIGTIYPFFNGGHTGGKLG